MATKTLNTVNQKPKAENRVELDDNISPSNNLPKGWKMDKLGNIGKVVSGGTPSTLVSDNFDGNISWITPADLTGYTDKFISKGRKSITEKGLKNSSAKLLPKGTILFSSRAPIGYVVIADNEMATNQGFKNLIPHDNIYSEFVYYYLKFAKQIAIEMASGTTFLELSAKSFSEIHIPIPPLPIQKAIVSKIEELFTEVDNGIKQLKEAQEQLKLFKQSVLKEAFTPKVDEDWVLKKLGELVNTLGDGLHGTPKYSENGEYFFINGNNLEEGKVVIKDSTKRINVEEFTKLRKPLGDNTIFVSINGTIGNLAFYNNEKISLGKSVCYFNLNHDLEKSYIYYLLKSDYFIQYANTSATGSTIKNVGLKAMREFIVPFPNLKGQQKIVSLIEQQFSAATQMEQVIIETLKDAELLKQSILKQAFEGKLLN